MKAITSVLFLFFVGCGISITTGKGNEENPILEIPTSETVVKLESAPCSEDGKRYQSTGLLLTHEGKVFVLTSEAFVYHGNEPYCHAIRVPESGGQLQLFAADWGNGLAIFQAPSLRPKSGMLTLETLAASPQAGNKVSVQGFPLKKNQLRIDEEGQVLLAASERHGIALLDEVTEIQGAFIDSGMVGGAVFHSFGGLAGMISHQYLKMTLGSRTRPFDWDGKAGHWERHWIVIPANVLKRFFEKAVIKGEKHSAFYRTPQDQELGRVVVNSAGINFQMECPTEDSGEIGEGPIGGADGVGVGGDGTVPYCKVQLSQAPSSQGEWPFDWRRAWKERMAREIGSGYKPESLFFIHRNTEDNRLARETFQSLGEFFRRLKDRTSTPVTIIPAKVILSGAPGFLIKEKAKTISRLAKGIYDFIPKVETGMEFMRAAYFILRVIESEEWDRIKKRELEILSDRNGKYHTDWVTMTRLTPEPADQLWKALQVLKDEVSD